MKRNPQLALLFLFIFLQPACKKEFNDLGTQFLVDEDLQLISFDDQPTSLSVVAEDSLISLNTLTSYLGTTYDAFFGRTNASIYTEFRMPSSNVDFGLDPVADSLVLSLVIDGTYGDTLTTLHVRANRMLEQIETIQADDSGETNITMIYSSDDFLYDTEELGEIDFTTAPATNNQLQIPLSNSLAQEILDADSLNYLDNEAFQAFFNGLYIVCDDSPENGVLLALDLLDASSKMTIYYHTDSSDSLSYDFQINSSADRMTRWKHDYSNTEIQALIGTDSTNKAYIQGGVGLRAYIDLPDLSSLKDSNYVVHKAELIFPYFSLSLDETFGAPSSLGLVAISDVGNIEILTEDQTNQGANYFDGSRNEQDQEYRFNIARYVYRVIEEGYTSRLCLYVPYSVSSPERVIIDNYSFDEERGVKLNLYVTKQ